MWFSQEPIARRETRTLNDVSAQDGIDGDRRPELARIGADVVEQGVALALPDEGKGAGARNGGEPVRKGS